MFNANEDHPIVLDPNFPDIEFERTGRGFVHLSDLAEETVLLTPAEAQSLLRHLARTIDPNDLTNAEASALATFLAAPALDRKAAR